MYLQACVSSLYTCLTDVRMNLRWKPRSVPSLNDWVQVKGTTSSKVTGPVSRVPDSYSSWLQSCGAGFILSRSVRSSPFSVLLTLFFVGKTSSRFYKNFSSWFFYVSDDFSSDFFFFFGFDSSCSKASCTFLWGWVHFVSRRPNNPNQEAQSPELRLCA